MTTERNLIVTNILCPAARAVRNENPVHVTLYLHEENGLLLEPNVVCPFRIRGKCVANQESEEAKLALVLIDFANNSKRRIKLDNFPNCVFKSAPHR